MRRIISNISPLIWSTGSWVIPPVPHPQVRKHRNTDTHTRVHKEGSSSECLVMFPVSSLYQMSFCPPLSLLEVRAGTTCAAAHCAQTQALWVRESDKIHKKTLMAYRIRIKKCGFRLAGSCGMRYRRIKTPHWCIVRLKLVQMVTADRTGQMGHKRPVVTDCLRTCEREKLLECRGAVCGCPLLCLQGVSLCLFLRALCAPMCSFCRGARSIWSIFRLWVQSTPVFVQVVFISDLLTSA